jgi:hypothetical protein
MYGVLSYEEILRILSAEFSRAHDPHRRELFGITSKPTWLLSGFGVVPIGHATRAATRVPSKAVPRCRALWTSWKKPR